MTALPLRVVTHRNWLAQRFAPYGGTQDFGMDLCLEEVLSYAWWAPGDWVARAHASGANLPLVSCGANWVERMGVPEQWLKRRVVTVSACRAVEAASELEGDTVFVKLPEAKTDAFPACLVFKNHLGSVLASPLIGEDTLVQLSEEIQFACEARFFVAHNRVVASSWYQNEGLVWVDEGFAGGTPYEMAVLTELANAVALNRKSPSGYTVDIGLIRGTSYTPAIVEFNAGWSSNPYDADMDGVVEAVRASNAHTLTEQEQRYQQDNWSFDVNGVPGVHRPLPVRRSYA